MTRVRAVLVTCDSPGCLEQWTVVSKDERQIIDTRGVPDLCKTHRVMVCTVCEWPVRPPRASIEEYPGTRKRVSADGKCNVCHANKLGLSDEKLAERSKKRAEGIKTHCRKCKKQMRPHVRSTAAEYPNLRARHSLDLCQTCHDNKGVSADRGFKDSDFEEQLSRLPAPKITDSDRRTVRRLIEDRYEADDWLLNALGLEGEDI